MMKRQPIATYLHLMLFLASLVLLQTGSVIAKPLSQAGYADLVIESISVIPPNPAPGQTAEIVVWVQNKGTVPTSAGFNTFMFINPTPQPPDSTSTTTLPPFGYFVTLPAGGRFKWVRTGQVFNAPGTYPVYAWVDKNNNVPEGNEDNNISTPFYVHIGSNADAYEPADSNCSQATPLQANASGQQHTLTVAGDEDWFRFDALPNTTYNFYANEGGVDADLRGGITNNCLNIPDPNLGSGYKLEDFVSPYTALTTFYILISHSQTIYGPDTSYDVRLEQLGVGRDSYRVFAPLIVLSPPSIATPTPAPTPTPTPFMFFERSFELEHNDSAQTANGPLRSGVTYQGLPDDLWDQYYVTLASGQNIVVQLSNPTNGTMLAIRKRGAGSSYLVTDNIAPYEIIYQTSNSGDYEILVFTDENNLQSSNSSIYSLKVTY